MITINTVRAKSFTALPTASKKYRLILKGNIIKKTNVRENGDFEMGQKRKKKSLGGLLGIISTPFQILFIVLNYST